MDGHLKEAEVVRAVAAGLERGHKLVLRPRLDREQLSSLLAAVVHGLDESSVVPASESRYFGEMEKPWGDEEAVEYLDRTSPDIHG